MAKHKHKRPGRKARLRQMVQERRRWLEYLEWEKWRNVVVRRPYPGEGWDGISLGWPVMVAHLPEEGEEVA